MTQNILLSVKDSPFKEIELRLGTYGDEITVYLKGNKHNPFINLYSTAPEDICALLKLWAVWDLRTAYIMFCLINDNSILDPIDINILMGEADTYMQIFDKEFVAFKRD